MKLLKTVFNVSLFVFGLSVLAQGSHGESGLKKVIVTNKGWFPIKES